MAILSGVCTSYIAECVQGMHSEGDEYYLALYTEGADVSPKTTKYKANNEARGVGYKPGGMPLTGFDVQPHDCCVCITFNDAVWPKVNLSAYGGLVYNKSKGNRAVAVISFGETVSSTNAPFRVPFPPSSADGLIVIES